MNVYIFVIREVPSVGSFYGS